MRGDTLLFEYFWRLDDILGFLVTWAHHWVNACTVSAAALRIYMINRYKHKLVSPVKRWSCTDAVQLWTVKLFTSSEGWPSVLLWFGIPGERCWDVLLRDVECWKHNFFSGVLQQATFLTCFSVLVAALFFATRNFEYPRILKQSTSKSILNRWMWGWHEDDTIQDMHQLNCTPCQCCRASVLFNVSGLEAC